MKKNIGLMLTQYEKFGTVGADEYLQYFIDEELDFDESDIGAYNEYLSENGYETYEDDLELILTGSSPLEIARMCYYGDFHFNYDYHKFNGYGNIDSFEASDIVKEMREDDDFKKWYVEYNELLDLESDEVLEAIEEANNLIKAGY